jgi:hypothetical protein
MKLLAAILIVLFSGQMYACPLHTQKEEPQTDNVKR